MYETDYSELVWEQKMMMDLDIIPQGNPWENADKQMEENIAYNESINNKSNEGFKEIENHMVNGEYYDD